MIFFEKKQKTNKKKNKKQNNLIKTLFCKKTKK